MRGAFHQNWVLIGLTTTFRFFVNTFRKQKMYLIFRAKWKYRKRVFCLRCFSAAYGDEFSKFPRKFFGKYGNFPVFHGPIPDNLRPICESLTRRTTKIGQKSARQKLLALTRPSDHYFFLETSVGNGVSEKVINNGVLEKNKISDEKMIFEARNRKEKKNISWADIVRTQVEHWVHE